MHGNGYQVVFDSPEAVDNMERARCLEADHRARSPPLKTRDTDCCSINLLKHFFHIFNVVFLIAGLAVLCVGVWSVLYKHQYVSLLTTVTYPLTSYVLSLAGILVIFVAILGCFGVCHENRCLILLYTFMLLLIFLLEAMVGVLAYIYREQVNIELTTTLNDTFLQSYRINGEKTAAIDRMQQELKCCGAIKFEDWKYSVWLKTDNRTNNLVPDSCCKTPSPGCGKRDHPSNIHYSGCLYRYTEELKSHLVIVSAVGLGICVIQVIGMIISCCLYIKLKDIMDFD
ncbi:CD151 antigen-like [Lycorma delicatula]|uniref:CD151 antigen-like n=1 Tax=Lycorma delicatula TaxID=130591 RepID=UPI003F5104A3